MVILLNLLFYFDMSHACNKTTLPGDRHVPVWTRHQDVAGRRWQMSPRSRVEWGSVGGLVLTPPHLHHMLPAR